MKCLNCSKKEFLMSESILIEIANKKYCLHTLLVSAATIKQAKKKVYACLVTVLL